MDPRPIGREEAAVVRTALEKAAAREIAPGLIDSIAKLTVMEECACGCSSVDFSVPPTGGRPRVLAHGIGTTQAGGRVGIIVWGEAGTLHELEIYDLGAGQQNLKLPLLESIAPFPPTGS